MMFKRIACASLWFFAWTVIPAEAQELERPPSGRTQYGPWNRDMDIYESQDGIHFVKKGIFVERAGVPNLAVSGDGTLYAVFQWFPLDQPEAFDQIASTRSHDGGRTWAGPRTIVMEGMPSSLFRAFDPTLVVLPNGRFRLYFASERASQRQGRGNRAVFSAISDDGVRYRFEPGQRFGFEDEETYDPSVAYFKGKWHLYCPKTGFQGEGYHAVSDNGLEFTEWEEVGVPAQGSWIGNPLCLQDTIRFYGSGPGGAWLAASSDGSRWRIEPAVNLPGGDPAVASRREGGLLAVTTGSLREDAASGPPPHDIDQAAR